MDVLAMYLRLSIEDEGDRDESNSITSQRLLIREYIRSHSEFGDYQMKEYCDDGYSGTNMERPDIQKLLEEVKAGRISCIIVKDLSRFARDYIELGTYMNQIFPFMGVRFIAVNDHYDSANHKGNTVEIDTAFKTLLYDLYSKDVSEKVKSSLKNKLSNGEYVYGQTPLGYAKDPDRKNVVIVNEEEAATVSYIFKLSCEGNSPVAIAKILYEENVPTAKQRRRPEKIRTDRITTWNETMVRKILTNRFYLGEFAYGKSTCDVGGKNIKRLPPEEWKIIKNHHQPLVTEAEFDSVTIFKRGKRKKNTRERNPLVGKLICGGCRYSMVFKPLTERNKRERFECRMHSKLQIDECCVTINKTVLQEIVLQELNNQILRLGDYNKQRNSLLETQKAIMAKLKEQLRNSKDEKIKLERSKDKAYEKYAAGHMTAEKYMQASEDSERKTKALIEKIENLNDKLNQNEEEYYKGADDLKQVIRYSHIDKLTQEVVDTFIKAIYVYHDKTVEIEWQFVESSVS